MIRPAIPSKEFLNAAYSGLHQRLIFTIHGTGDYIINIQLLEGRMAPKKVESQSGVLKMIQLQS